MAVGPGGQDPQKGPTQPGTLNPHQGKQQAKVPLAPTPGGGGTLAARRRSRPGQAVGVGPSSLC